MVKKIGMVLLCTLLGGAVYARDISESQKFIGVEISISEVQGQAASELEGSISNGTSFGLRLGAQNEQWRTMFGLTYFDNEGRNVEKLYLSIDYFFLKYDVINNYAVQPYIGGNVGYMNYESIGVDEDGFVYGGQGGVILGLTEKIDFDLAYRYSLSSALALDHIGETVFGLNYRY